MPQPIDFNTEVAKVTAAERAQEVMARVSLAAQQRQTAAEQQNQVQAETQVIQTAGTENLTVEPEPKRKNPFVGRRRRQKTSLTIEEPQQKSSEQASLSGKAFEEQTHRFDVKV